MSIILASGSPRRSQILKDAGFEFSLLKMDVDESFDISAPVVNVPLMLASRKMEEALKHTEINDIVITADTVVILNDKIIGKPLDRSDAFAILSALSGNMHRVVTGICITKNETRIELEVTTKVVFEIITAEEIDYYLDHYMPYDKAGAYAIQEWIGMNKIASIEGDYYNVVGFPMSRIYPVLKALLD